VEGWVSVNKSDSTCRKAVAGTLSLTRQAAGEVDFGGIEAKRMLTWLARKSTMLSKTTPHDEAIELHEEL
jgi:hypothetical protein